MDAMKHQVGGTHYKRMPIQPFEFGHANRYDPEVFSIMKYVSRFRFKGGAEDLDKAIHIADIRLAMVKRWGHGQNAVNKIPVGMFIEVNQIPEPDADALRAIHYWAMQEPTERSTEDIKKRIAAVRDNFIKEEAK